MATFSDDFNRADSGTLGANWTNVTGSSWSIVSNQAVGPGSASATVYNSACSAADNFSQGYVPTFSGTQHFIARSVSSGSENCYSFRIGTDGSVILYKAVSGTFTSIGTVSSSASTTNPYKLTCAGSTITCFYNGTNILQVTDTSVTTGLYVGFRSSVANHIDNWTGGDGTGSGTAATASGSITLAGSATANGAGTATGSLSLAASATANGAGTATGSLTFGGSVSARAALSPSGGITLSGTVEAQAAATATGSLALAGTAAAFDSSVISAAGSLTLGGTATATPDGVAASGSLTFGGTAFGTAPITGVLELAVGAAVLAEAAVVATGSLDLSGAGTASLNEGATGSMEFDGIVHTVGEGGHIYRLLPPTVREGPVGPRGLWSINRGITLQVTGGVVTQNRYPSDISIEEADYTYLGGHEYVVTDAEALVLANGGYASNLTFAGDDDTQGGRSEE